MKKMREEGEVEANPVENYSLINENNCLLILGNLGQSVQHSVSKRRWYTLCSKECDS